MPKLLVENPTDKPLTVVIEPWAGCEILAPKERLNIEYAGAADIEVCVQDDGALFIAVMSDGIQWEANGREVKLVGDASRLSS
jgi:hypothetical protein